MKKIIFLLTAILSIIPAMAQSKAQPDAKRNSTADNIIGNYKAVQGGEESKVKIFKASDGTYTIQVYWVKNPNDANGKPKLDEKNPDKSLRNVKNDQIVLCKGMKYDSASKTWGGAKIYDPTRGIKANIKAEFLTDGKLRIKGTVMGIGETVYWDKLAE